MTHLRPTSAGPQPQGSLWNRLNLFLPRPSSVFKKHAEGTENDQDGSVHTKRLSSVDDEVERRYHTLHTPLPPASPDKPRRTPSILRTLAHHPSLSVLKSRSKKKRGLKARSPIPAMPAGDMGFSDDAQVNDLGQLTTWAVSQNDCDRSLNTGSTTRKTAGEPRSFPSPRRRGGVARISPSPKRNRLRKESLWKSQSVPRDLRLMDDVEERPPLPGQGIVDTFGSTPMPASLKLKRARTPTPRRKPVPSSSSLEGHEGKPALPDISGCQPRYSTSPDSARISRMRFSFDLEMNGSGSPGRKRASSHNPLDCSPRRIIPSATPKHLSTPASPPKSITRQEPQMSARGGLHHPLTSQHPHPVPLSPAAELSYMEKIQYHRDSHPTDEGARKIERQSQSHFRPTQDQLGLGIGFRGHEAASEVDDGLDVLVKDEALPIGTPGGKKADLKRGVFLDGVRPERGAVRLFSRDTYERFSISPSPSPPAADSGAIQKLSRAVDSPSPSVTMDPNPRSRSASPFEVKLTPVVTKRMSLDAFGTPEPPPSHTDEGSAASDKWSPATPEVEEVLDETSSEVEDHQQGSETFEWQNAPIEFRHTTLSTIRETVSSKGSSNFGDDLRAYVQPTPLPHTPWSGVERTGGTEFFTPFSLNDEDEDANGLPSNGFSSLRPPHRVISTSPSQVRRHLSAPPSPLRVSAPAHSEDLEELQAELQTRDQRMAELQIEQEGLRKQLAEQEDELSWAKLDDREKEKKELLALIEKMEGDLEVVLDQTKSQKTRYEALLEEHRVTLGENEEFAVALQAAHDDLASRFAELESEHFELMTERSDDAKLLIDLQAERDSLKKTVTKHRSTDAKAQEAISELQMTIVESETRLEDAETAHTARISELASRIEDLEAAITARDQKIEDLEEILRDGLEREGEIGRLQKVLASRDRESSHLQHLLNESRDKLSTSRRDVEDREMELAKLQNRLDHSDELVTVTEKDLKAALRQNTAKDSIIGVLRDKLQTASYANDEKVSTQATEISVLKAEAAAKALEVRQLEEDVRRRDARVKELHAEVERQKQEGRSDLAERIRDLEEEIVAVKADRERLDRRAAESEVAARGAVESTAKFEEERRAWEEEKLELIEETVKSTHYHDRAEDLARELDDAREALASSQVEHANLEFDLNQSNELLDNQARTILDREDDIACLRKQLREAEEAIHSGESTSIRRAREAESKLQALQNQLDDLVIHLQAKDDALRIAVMGAESEKVSSTDVKSRLEAYLAQINRLSLVEASLKKELEDARRESSGSDLKVSDMEKRIQQLEEDKELLNVALESKQTEVVLLQRQRGPGSTPRSARKSVSGNSLSGSTSRPQRPTSALGAAGKETRDLSISARQYPRPKSAAASPSGRTKRDSWVPPSPTPRIPSTPTTKRTTTGYNGTPRPKRDIVAAFPRFHATPSNNEIGALGVSTKHNEVANKRVSFGGAKDQRSGLTGKASRDLDRRSSIPVLVKRMSFDFQDRED